MLKSRFLNSLYRKAAWALAVKLPSGKCHRTPLIEESTLIHVYKPSPETILTQISLSIWCHKDIWVKALMNPLLDCSDLNWLEEQPWGIETPIYQCLTNELPPGGTVSEKRLDVFYRCTNKKRNYAKFALCFWKNIFYNDHLISNEVERWN